ncbi:MAG: DMT family transporter [Betaproteobacteria bacterium]|nr:DMT family transporter [Betaproteobacteria bacterium]
MSILSNEPQHKIIPILALLCGATIWGLVWYPYRLMEHAGVPGEISTGITYFVAFLLGLTFFHKSVRPALIFNGQGHLLFYICFFAGWTNIAYIFGILLGEIMRVLLLFYLAPLWTIFFSWLLLNEKLSKYGYFVIALSLTGATTMLWQPHHNFPLPSSSGDWLGLLGGITFALVNVLVRKDQSHSIEVKSMAICLGAALVGFGCMLVMGSSLTSLEMSDNTWFLLLGVGLAMFMMSMVLQYGLTHTPANQAIVILLFELFVAAIAAYFLVNEAMSLMEWLGGIMIISASLFSTKMNRH